jgi:hypothetical protein
MKQQKKNKLFSVISIRYRQFELNLNFKLFKKQKKGKRAATQLQHS